MPSLQEIFNNLQAKKQRQSEVKKVIKESLENYQEYKELLEEIKKLKTKKKQIETTMQADFSHEVDQLKAFKTDIASDNVILSDLALNNLIKGESIKITTEDNIEFEPVITVRFKKIV